MLTFRRATPDDLDQVLALRLAFLQDLQPEAPLDEIRELTRRYLEEKLPTGEFQVWFAEAEGQIVGTAGLVFSHRPPTLGYRSEHHAYLLNMYTVPEWRRRGVATALLRHILDYVKCETPARRIALHATDEGRSVYERLGFAVSGRYMSLTL